MAARKNITKANKDKKNRKTHPYRSYLNEIRPTWKNNPDKIKPMVVDMINKKYQDNVERYMAIKFIDRFLAIHRRKIRSFDPEIFDEMKSWIMIQGTTYLTDAFFEFKKQEYGIKHWIRKDFHLTFLDREITKMKKLWEHLNMIKVEETGNESFSEILEDGRLPKLNSPEFKHLPRAVSALQYMDFLMAEKKRLLSKDMASTMKVPIVLHQGDESHEDQLIIQIPAGFFKLFQTEPIKENVVASNPTQKIQASTNPKYYTRAETADILGISLPKLDQFTKEGTIKCRRIGDSSMKRYTIEDIQGGLKQIEYDFGKRFV